MIKKIWVVFKLDDAVSGFSSSGIQYDDTSFTLYRQYDACFNSEAECENFINATLKDYKKREVGNKTRFVILPVYCFDDDEQFKVE